MQKMKSRKSPDMSRQPKLFHQRVIELAARWYVFWFLNVYGLGKILGGQFYRRGRLPEDVAKTVLGEANAFDLAWTFMGYSFAYILFIGLAEVVGAWLLLWERTKLFGVAVFLPVMVNIVVFDIIFLDTHGATASATIYTLLLFVILFCNREAVGQALRALVPQAQPTQMPLKQKAKRAMLALLLMGLLFAFDQMLVNLFGHGRG
jgi:hypothetical protein